MSTARRRGLFVPEPFEAWANQFNVAVEDFAQLRREHWAAVGIEPGQRDRDLLTGDETETFDHIGRDRDGEILAVGFRDRGDHRILGARRVYTLGADVAPCTHFVHIRGSTTGQALRLTRKAP